MLSTCLAAVVLAAPPPAELGPHSQVFFVDVTEQAGIFFRHHGGIPVPPSFEGGMNVQAGLGAAVSDYDRDGDHDVYLCDGFLSPNKLFRNDGDGTFTEVAQEAGVADLGWGHMALFLDLDNDGWDDLLVVNDCSEFFLIFPRPQLYRNNRDGTFTNLTSGSGFDPVDPVFGGATAGDYDKDGDLDIFIVGWSGWTTRLYRNEGDFTFTDVTAEAGAHVDDDRFQWTPVFADFDNDGWQDIFCAVDFGEDYLLRNNGDGTFTDISKGAGTLHVFNDMGAAVADIDHDLDLDIYTTNITGGEKCGVAGGCNMLYLNDGDGTFSDGTALYGIGDTAWGWGVCFFDANLDTNRDLLAVNGWMQPEWRTPAYFYHRESATDFVERAEQCGIDHVGNGNSRGLTPLDYDNDGDIDFLISDVMGDTRLYENRTERDGRHWLIVEAQGTVSNRNGVGARVYVEAGGLTQMHEIMVGGSFYAAPPLEAHFGLGPHDTIEKLWVVFPSGEVARMKNVPADQRLRVVEGGEVVPIGRQ